MSGTPFAVNASVIICQDDKFLLIKRAADEEVFPGYWGIPGGAVETFDTSLETAIQRECDEEVGVSVKELSFVADNVVERNGEVVLFVVYKGKLDAGTPEPKEDTELVAWKTLDEAKLLQLTPQTLDHLVTVSAKV